MCSPAEGFVQALLKDLSKNGLPHHALAIFDSLQSLPSENELSSLSAVFTYTIGMTQLMSQLQPSKHHKPCAPFACEQVIIIYILVFIVFTFLSSLYSLYSFVPPTDKI